MLAQSFERQDVEGQILAFDLFVPSRLDAHSKLLLCFPGGGSNRQYFNLADGDDRRFSFAAAMTAHGHAVVTIDPPGVNFDPSLGDPYAMTVKRQLPLWHQTVEAINASLLQQIARPLPMVGVGHSAGCMALACLQAQHRLFDAVAILCFGTAGLPQHLDQQWLDIVATDRSSAYARLPEFARAKFPQAFRQMPAPVKDTAETRALSKAFVPVLAPIALQSMTPGNVAAELAMIDVPIFTAAGKRDMLGPHHLLGAAYPTCPDYTQVTVAGAGHHLFVAKDACQFFGRFAAWLSSNSVAFTNRNDEEL